MDSRLLFSCILRGTAVTYPIVDINDVRWPPDLKWHLGVTGTRRKNEGGHSFPTHDQLWAMEQMIAMGVSHGAWWLHHGACTGWDEAAVRYVRAAFPGLVTVAHPPIKEDHLSRAAIEGSHIVHKPKNYHDRDHDIAVVSEFLLSGPAWAEHDERARRSGTWLTIRLARNFGTISYACDLEGNIRNVTEAA
jgi:hypothetical protein